MFSREDTTEPSIKSKLSQNVLCWRYILSMLQDGKPDEEPQAVSPTTEAKSSSGKAPWSGLNSIITEEEIKSSKSNLKLVTKILLGEIDRLGREISELKVYRDDFHRKSEQLLVITERLTGLQESVTVRALLFALGGLTGGLVFLPDLVHYQVGIFLLCMVCFGLAIWNPQWLRTVTEK